MTDRTGKTNLTLGCHPDGGFVDVLHAGSGRLAVTLAATPDGGTIEVTDKDGNCVFDVAETRAVNAM